MKILFVAYYFEPFAGVGAKRISYWAKQIAKHEKDIDLEVVTATPKSSTNEFKVHYVEDVKNNIFGKLFKSDRGASWSSNLKTWFKLNNDYDIILFTCGPFIHLRLVPWIKKQNPKSKLIIDFRDPMATNPRSNFTTLNQRFKNSLIKFMEKSFVSKADHIISVNKQCLGLIAGCENLPTSIIDNGYDEEILKTINQDTQEYENVKLVYAGSFFRDRNPTHLLEYLKEFNSKNEPAKQIHFVHVGQQSEYLKSYKDFNWLVECGVKTYNETLEIISSCHFGLIFTLGHPFESTTKFFDYIALRKKILIFANSVPQEGPLVEYGKLYTSTYWSENKKTSIESLMNKKIKSEQTDKQFDVDVFSRKAGLVKLLAVFRGI